MILIVFSQVERPTVESYSGYTAPPCIEVIVTPAGDNIGIFPNLAHLIKLTGMEQPSDILLKKGVLCGSSLIQIENEIWVLRGFIIFIMFSLSRSS